MLWEKLWFMFFFFEANAVLVCYNCSSTHREWNNCGGDFIPYGLPFNTTRKNLINCTGENPMCFVRSWTARSRHAWIVQRGCYQANADDVLPRSMNMPTRAMSCKLERHPDADYKVCLCQADWCNSASSIVPTTFKSLIKLSRNIPENIIPTLILFILGVWL